jgi:non-homologous end joining protein Ku
MDTLEIIRQLENDEALREELRAILLTKDLLEMPKHIVQLEKAVTELVEVSQRHEETLQLLVEIANRHENILNILIDTAAQQRQDFNDLRDMYGQSLRIMESGFKEMRDGFAQIDMRLRRLEEGR